MACPVCRHDNSPGSEVCLGCGWVLVNDCAVCGARPPIKSSFCNQCGTSLDPRRDARLRVETLFNESSREGERKQVTVLFADLKGSMDLLVNTRSRGRPGGSWTQCS